MRRPARVNRSRAQFDPDGSLLVVTHVDGGYQVVDCALDGGAHCTPVSEVEDKPMRLILTEPEPT